MLTIDVISDVICPWCFIGKRRLEKALGVRSAVQNTSNAPRHALFAHFSRRDSPLLLADPHASPSVEMLARFDEATRVILMP